MELVQMARDAGAKKVSRPQRDLSSIVLSPKGLIKYCVVPLKTTKYLINRFEGNLPS